MTPFSGPESDHRPLHGPFQRGHFPPWRRGARKQPMSLIGAFPLLDGPLPECLHGPFSVSETPWKTAHYYNLISSCVLGFFARGFSRKCLHWRGSFWKKFLWDLQEKIASEDRKTQNKALRRGSWTKRPVKTVNRQILLCWSCFSQGHLWGSEIRLK